MPHSCSKSRRSICRAWRASLLCRPGKAGAEDVPIESGVHRRRGRRRVCPERRLTSHASTPESRKAQPKTKQKQGKTIRSLARQTRDEMRARGTARTSIRWTPLSRTTTSASRPSVRSDPALPCSPRVKKSAPVAAPGVRPHRNARADGAGSGTGSWRSAAQLPCIGGFESC